MSEIISLQKTKEEDAKPFAPEHVCRTPQSYAGQWTQPPRAWSRPGGDPYGRCKCESLLQIFKLDGNFSTKSKKGISLHTTKPQSAL